MSGYFRTLGKIAAIAMQLALAALPIEAGESFTKQWEFVEHKSTSLAVLCSRRSGKTTGAFWRVAKLSSEQRGRRTLYVHHTRENARDQFFLPLKKFLDDHHISYASNEGKLCLWLSNGSFVQCIGCNNSKGVGTKRGFKWSEIIIDECQDFDDDLLKRLLDEALLPTLFDAGGVLIMMGTPPRALAGEWHRTVCSGAFTQLKWTLIDNPWVSRDNVVEVMGRRGFVIDWEKWENNDPVVQREVFGLLAVDTTMIVYLYEPGRNDIPATGPHQISGDLDQWQYSMGIDLGMSDCDAIFVWGWRKNDPQSRLYQFYSWKKNHVLFDDLAERAQAVYKQFRPRVIVGDTGGHGAVKVIESLAHRLGVGEIEKKPASVKDSVALLNDEYRAGRAFIEAGGDLATESRKVVWDGKRENFDNIFHSDITEAARYAHHAALLAGYYRGKAPPAPPTERELRDKRIKEAALRRTDPFKYGTAGGSRFTA